MSTPPSEPRRGRGRPRKFDHATALDAALLTFWKRGYGGTSLDDLTAAMGMNRPSIYAAFGNKEAVYAAAVDHYVATIARRYLDPLAKRRDLRAELMAFYDAIIDVVTGRYGPHGCIVACTLPAEAEVSPQARKQLARVLFDADRALGARIALARDAGEIGAESDVRQLAALAASGTLALSIRARAGAPRRELRRLAQTFVTAVTGGIKRPRAARRSSA
ncbi:MAG: TetR/AcrR family transcriptional regulator [Candidatus Binatia bacterium]